MLRKWFKDEEGQGMVEYGLIIGLIAVVVMSKRFGIKTGDTPKLKRSFNIE